MAERIAATDVSPRLRALAELLGRQPRLAGRRIELLFDERGRLMEMFTHDRLGATETAELELVLEEGEVVILRESPPAG